MKFLVEQEKFTIKQLEEYNGKNGQPTYVAFQEYVYDLSKSRLWYDGDHKRRHRAGKDLTEELKRAPHGKNVLKRAHVKLVGRII